MKLLRVSSCLLAFAALALPLSAQTLYVPGGTLGNISGSNVGIGTASPSQKLTVAGNINKSGSWIVGDFAWGANTFEIHSSSWDGASNGAYGGFAAGHGYFYGGLQSGGPSGGEAGNGQLYVSDNSMLLGNVGIGTTNPSSKLHINDSSHLTSFQGTSPGQLQVQIPNITGDVAKLSFTQFDGQATAAVGMSFTGSGSSLYFGTSNNWGSGVTNTALTIDPSGNVGIGTTNPGTYKLAVNGSIRAKEVIVDTGWSDYVFDDGYKLKALSEVEAYVKTEKHLPGIPSAKEVAEHGVSMGEIQSKLLAKVEELTLHLIAQEKRDTAQQKQLATQQAEIAALRAEVGRLSSRHSL